MEHDTNMDKDKREKMQRVVVVGCGGAGKSTFTREFHKITKLPLVHLDAEYWHPNWTEPDKILWVKKVRELIGRDKWVMDGNFYNSMDVRFERADTIIFLDLGTFVCIKNVFKRIIMSWFDSGYRADLPKGCKECFDLKFLLYVISFNIKKRKKIIAKLNNLKNKNIVDIKNHSEAKEYLKKLKSSCSI